VNIEFNVLDRQYNAYKAEYDEAVISTLASGWYILGRKCEQFEEKYAKFIGAKHCVSLNSGLDALILAVKALGIGEGDEIIVQANTYIATILAITKNNATPIFIEPDEYYNIDALKIEGKITPKTKAIIVVHLYGQTSDMFAISDIAKKYGLYVIEDCAQSHTAKVNGKMTGTLSDIGCFSFFPTKNMGAFGDGGAIVTDNAELANQIKKLRNYGSSKKYVFEYEGINSRLDEIQASLLLVKLKHIDKLINERKKLALKYLSGIKNNKVILPQLWEQGEHVWHLFVVRTDERDKFMEYLAENGVKTQIHYPIPPHLSECYAYMGYKAGDFPITELYSDTITSLPLYNGMTDDEIDYVIDIINKY
jgi:dTDP-4-amino-4,6-dideoxygalactose transaminase